MIELLPLHQHPEYIESAIAILSQQWPKDESLRRRTIEKSNDNFKPTCLVLVETETGTVLGFVKLTGETLFGKAIFIESLVVHFDKRGKGYGRKLLELTEVLVRKSGKFDRINLTTIDKVEFYQKMGYQLQNSSFKSVPNKTIQENFSSKCQNESSETMPNPTGLPPPPPPLTLSQNKTNSLDEKVFMWKTL